MAFGLGADVGNIAGFVAKAQDEGLSATAALNAFRGAGGAIRDARFYQAYGEVAASRAGEVRIGEVPLHTAPPRSAMSEWSAGRRGQYATQVRVLVRESGSDQYRIRHYTHVTEGPHSGQEAIDAAVDAYDINDGDYHDSVAGGFISGYYAMTGAA